MEGLVKFVGALRCKRWGERQVECLRRNVVRSKSDLVTVRLERRQHSALTGVNNVDGTYIAPALTRVVAYHRIDSAQYTTTNGWSVLIKRQMFQMTQSP